MTTPRNSIVAAPGDALQAWMAFQREWADAYVYSALVRLSRRAETLSDDPALADRLVPLRIGVMGSATVDFILPVLKGALMARGVRPTMLAAPYGHVSMSLLDHHSVLAQFQPQVTVVIHAAPHLPDLPELTATPAEVQRCVDATCEKLLEPCGIFHSRTGSEIVLSNFHPLPWRAAGNVGARLPGDPISFVNRLNMALSERAPRYVHILDVASLANRVGVANWFDERYWYLAKQPMSFNAVPLFSRNLAAVIGSLVGRGRKCIAVDLDNTLWGGVIGDDGLSGIQLGEGSPEGESFKAFQMYLRELKDRGILLAACSKNDEAVARSPFLEHPEMVLRLDDFAAFKANWSPKSENLRALSAELNLPLDAFVFIDDNPAEREEVARAVPEVAVASLPDDPAGYVRALDGQFYFETVALSEEDLRRTATYQARRQSQETFAATTDLDGYLASLQMVASVDQFLPESFERVTQLINKTNQFNLTTPRLLRADVERMAWDASMVTRAVRLRDRFGDHGLISVLFGRIENRSLLLDAWLMSCRVLGRGVEALLFNDLLRTAERAGITELIGFYRPTDRNAMVKDHYGKLGFVQEAVENGVERWRLSVARACPIDTHVSVRHDTEPAA